MALMNMAKSINLALFEAMERDKNVIVMGEDVGPDEGVFRITEGLYHKFGEKRVLDTPLAESGIVGTAIGLAMYGMKPVCEIQFSGFDYYAFHQLECHASRFRNRTRGRHTVPLVMRAPYGGGIRALEHHSESREAIYAHTPGLKVVIPSGPRNARALLHSAIQDPDPVIYYEPKALYRLFKEEVPETMETLPIGQSQIVRAGKDITIISYGASLRAALEAAEMLEEEDGVKAEVVDLLTIAPLDATVVIESVKKTGRAVIVHEGPRTCGLGAEVVARVNEAALLYLEAPIRRVTGFDTPIPYFSKERFYLPDPERVLSACRETLEF
ncbi:MAG: alpha-ketoacid dehydrogenase subunit beta [Candidatus Obscuribacter sp.]|jgi:pyruvate dehydrogenase E1 component beta subunit|nr:alpha-ketoacid dehydrogenase subunit beta [Candidatus Obscuribacter sp.]MDQ5965687.1 pyruvate dehydrogenase component beta subunit [Cyanobacteriota bacterium erpe_2018_sw_39hr_WHONDRS-SW48-000098_B_bin.30]MBK7837273.1 alpha-ketoacid dehydrogenase subunit beta [Candidatus Obscuribacter sp.]MBK9201863.1 alpha-ketoacid dehydrogenase subunit beta [Candidatus Obscuribacter sp.]MBK9620150.1 alpha-ketoacid dehydrogenase subunit beta [Candidatus Obscuribacter sp.]